MLGRGSASLRRSLLSDFVTAKTAQDVSALYEQLWDRRPPRLTDDQRTFSDAARALAADVGVPFPAEEVR